MSQKLQSLKQLKDAIESGDRSNYVALVDQCFDTIDQGTAALRAWSGSLNSAFDLQKQLLPSHSAVVNTNGGAQLHDPIHGAQSPSFNIDPACAWLVAILNVLIAMEEETSR